MSSPEEKKTPIKKVAVTSLSFSVKTLQDYKVLSVIGNGAFGTCFKVRDKENDQIYAWKVIRYDELKETHKKFLASEIEVLRQLQHPNIVQYFHHLVNYETKSVFIVMEYCEGGDLAQLIAKAKVENKRFEEHYIWRVLFQICQALCVCHNKIKEFAILHRDIKPANIFLDTKGDAKLGDFGLARLLRRNETFAHTFVGTPYYMSPETIKGSKYDRKSDVWAVGCLIYEMSALRPPFDGEEFSQLSTTISTGNFPNIPDIYSKDLQEIIAYMLEVKYEKRPNIEMLSRHPVLLRNTNELSHDFPVLVDMEPQHQDFKIQFDKRRKLEYSPLRKFSGITFTEQNSFNEGYGQRCLSFTNIFTPDLKSELFDSAKRKIYAVNSKLQFSDPELYDNIRRENCPSSIDVARFKHLPQPYEITRDVFNDVLQKRLKAIRAQESLLRQREENLNTREKQLNEREKRLIAFEQSLASKCQLFKEKCSVSSSSANERLPIPLPEEKQKLTNIQLPVPTSNNASELDDTYCSIDLNDTTHLHQPTMAKLNMADLPVPKVFPNLRKVTFQSPRKFLTYHIKNKKQKPSTETANTKKMHSSSSSKSSEESSESAAASSSSSVSTAKRKSILSIFGLRRNYKEAAISSPILSSTTDAEAVNMATAEQKFHKQEERIISKCETADISNIWTRAHKKAAFQMLAAMNAAESTNNAPRHKTRQSLRDRNSLKRSCLRRSLIVAAPLSNSHQRGQLLV